MSPIRPKDDRRNLLEYRQQVMITDGIVWLGIEIGLITWLVAAHIYVYYFVDAANDTLIGA